MGEMMPITMKTEAPTPTGGDEGGADPAPAADSADSVEPSPAAAEEADTVEELTRRLGVALGAVASGGRGPRRPSNPKLVGRGMDALRKEGGGRTTTTTTETAPAALSASFQSAARPGHRRRSLCEERSIRSLARSMAPAIPDWKGYYKPRSTSRRNSRAGTELSASRKLDARKMLAELGEPAYDDGDDDLSMDDGAWLESLGCVEE